MKFSIQDFFSKYDLRIWSDLPLAPFMENCSFCAVFQTTILCLIQILDSYCIRLFVQKLKNHLPRKVCFIRFIESHLKMMKNAFYST